MAKDAVTPQTTVVPMLVSCRHLHVLCSGLSPLGLEASDLRQGVAHTCQAYQ
jgi:hypothetical protein